MITSQLIKNYFSEARVPAERLMDHFNRLTMSSPDPNTTARGFYDLLIERRLGLNQDLRELAVATETMKVAFRAEPLLGSRISPQFDILENHQKTTFQRVHNQLENTFSKAPTEVVAFFKEVKSFGVENIQDFINTLNGAEKNIVSYLPHDRFYRPELLPQPQLEALPQDLFSV